MVPGLLTIESPTRAANPERGWTSPTIPNGMATATPVRTRARCPGASVTSSALKRSTPASPSWARLGIGSAGSRRTTARLVDTGPQTTLDRVSGTRIAPHSVRYRERLWVPWWWWPLGFALAALIAFEVNMGVKTLPDWLPFATLFTVAAGTLLWLGRVEIRVTVADSGVQLWAGHAHLPVTVIARSAEIARSTKSAALGRQLDPAAYVVHRGWVGPMVLLVLNDV